MSTSRFPGDLQRLYDQQLGPELARLESIRKKVLSLCILPVISFAIVGVGVYGLYLVKYIPGANFSHQARPFALVVFGFVAMVYSFVSISKRYQAYVKEFKARVVKAVVKFVDPSIIFVPEQSIPEATYQESQLFLTGVDRYLGDDYCSGKIGDTDFEFSDLHTQYIVRSKDSKGNNQTRHETIFHGIFFSGNFHKNISGSTFVLADSAESLFGKKLGKFLQSNNMSRDQLVKMDDPEFEKRFVVYSNDQAEARNILSPDMMKRIVELRTKLKCEVHLSFKGTRVYVAMCLNRNSFEPRLWSSGAKVSSVLEIHGVLTDTIGVAEALSLNSNMWTRS